MTKETPLAAAAVRERLGLLPGWDYTDGAIHRLYKTDGWPTTLMLVNAIGFYAEAADHHPDLRVRWGSVEITLSTHSAGGVTTKDLEMARVIEQLALWRPGPRSPFRGTPKQFVLRENA